MATFIDGRSLTCNGTTVFYDVPLVITGNSSKNSVQIANTNATAIFSNVAITTKSPVHVFRSTLRLISEGQNNLIANSAWAAGIECSSDSNITL
jgi:hypothetical protein